MLTIYTNKKDIDKTKKLIYYIDLEFNKQMYSLEINDLDKQYMQNIDCAKYLGNGMIETLFGVTKLASLSTGCKALILLNHLKDNTKLVLNVSECGQNALDYIFKLDKGDILLEFKNRPSKFDNTKHIKLIKNNKESIIDLVTLFSKGWK